MSDKNVLPVLLKLRHLGLVDFNGNLTPRGRELIHEYSILVQEAVAVDFYS
jgi:hypothetical protein